MDAGLTFRLRRRTIVILLLISALLAAVMPLRGKSSELPVYMTAAGRFLRGEEIYRADDRSAFTYPPFFVLPMLPLAPLPPLARARVWWFVNLCLAGVVLAVVARLVWPTVAGSVNRGHRLRWALALLIAVLAGRFLVSPLEYQSHDLIVLALIALSALATARERDAAAGICAGLAAACKATPLLFLPWFCWRRRYRAAACLLATLLAATMLPDLLVPAPNGQLWAVHWYDTFVSKVRVGAPAQAAGVWCSWNMLNQSLSATIYRLTTPAESQGDVVNVCLFPMHNAIRQRLTFALELLVVGWLAWCTWPRRRNATALDPDLAALTEVGMIICAMLMLSPVSSSQHFAALLVPIAACATYWLCVRRDRFVAGALLLVFLFGTLAARDILGQFLGRCASWPQAVGCKTWVAAALFLACGHIPRTAGSAAEAVPEKKGTVPICAKHPSGRSGKWGLSPFSWPRS